MHELSICQSLVDAIAAEMRKIKPPPKRLLKASVTAGALRQIIPDHLASAYEIMTKGTALEGSKLEIIPMPLAGECEACGWRGEFSIEGFRCPACGSKKARITGGRELHLSALEVEHDS